MLENYTIYPIQYKPFLHLNSFYEYRIVGLVVALTDFLK
jgi:hypothetical protein